jgi:hypothetical protein
MKFCDKPPTWTRICHTSNRCSFWHHASMSLTLCMSNCGCLVINLFYHTYISFVLYSFLFSFPYPPWLATSYSCTFFTLLMWTYHWWFGYPLVWCSCRNEHIITHDFFEILSQLLFWKVDHMYRKRFFTFSPTMINNGSIFLSLKIVFKLNGRCCS